MGQFRRSAIGVWCLLVVLLSAPRSTGAQNVSVQAGPAFGTFTVVNEGSPVSLRADVSVQQLVEDTWKDILVTNLYLRKDCLAPPPHPCVAFSAGGVMRPVRWTGRYCLSQCPSPCRLDGSAPKGIYRFVIHTCAGTFTATSPAFDKSN